MVIDFPFVDKLITSGGLHKTDLHHFGLPLSQIHRVHVLGPGT